MAAAKKKKKLADYTEINLGGVPTRVYGGTLTDEERRELGFTEEPDMVEVDLGNGTKANVERSKLPALREEMALRKSIREAPESVPKVPVKERAAHAQKLLDDGEFEGALELANELADEAEDPKTLRDLVNIQRQSLKQLGVMDKDGRVKRRPAEDAETGGEGGGTLKSKLERMVGDTAKGATGQSLGKDTDEALDTIDRGVKDIVAEKLPSAVDGTIEGEDMEVTPGLKPRMSLGKDTDEALRVMDEGVAEMTAPEGGPVAEGPGAGTLKSKLDRVVGDTARVAVDGGTEDAGTPSMPVPDLGVGSDLTSPPTETGDAQMRAENPAGFSPEAKDTMARAAWGIINPAYAIQTPGERAREAGKVFPQAAPDQTKPVPAAPEAPAPGAPAPLPGAQPQMAGTPGAGGGGQRAAIMAKMREGAEPSPVVAQQAADQRALLENAARNDMAAAGAQSIIERDRMQKEHALRQEALKQEVQLNEQRAVSQAAYAAAMERGQSALNDVLQERREVAKQRVDPDRYWREAGAGRRAASIIAGALFGFAGQGMQYLQHLKSLVDRDVKLQQDDITRAGDTLDAVAGDTRNIIALAKERGLSDVAAVEAAKAGKYAELKQQLEMLATEAGIKSTEPQFMHVMAGIDREFQKSLAGVEQFEEQTRLREQQQALEAAKLRQHALEVQLRYAPGPGGPAGAKKDGKLVPAVFNKLVGTQKAILALERMKELAQDGGFLDRFWRAGKEHWNAEERGKLQEFDNLSIEFARYVAGSALQKHEADLILKNIGSRSGILSSVPRIEEALKSLHKVYEMERKTAEAGGDYGAQTMPVGGSGVEGETEYGGS